MSSDKMIKVLGIQWSGETIQATVKQNTALEEMKAIAGYDVGQPVFLDGVTMIVNDNGIMDGDPINKVATSYLHGTVLHHLGSITPTGIHGNVFLVGDIGDEVWVDCPSKEIERVDHIKRAYGMAIQENCEGWVDVSVN